MTVQEISITERTPGLSPVARLKVGNTEYAIVGSDWHATVLCGRWLHSGYGKTFHDAESLQKHYKRHGSILVEYAKRVVTNWT